MKEMKIMNLILMFFIIYATFLSGSELGNKNLKGIQYVTVCVEFNGVLYGEGYVDQKEEVVKELNLEEVVLRLKEDGIPFSKGNIREIYRRMEFMVQKGGIRTLKMKKYSKKDSTIIPTLCAKINTMAASEDLYLTVIHLTLSKWISNWSGTSRILAPVYTWSEKKMLAAAQKELYKAVEKTVMELMNVFIMELREVNPD